MKPYEVSLKVRNNYLLTVMKESGIKSALELSRVSGVSAAIINDMINLKSTLFNKKDEVRTSVLRLCEVLNTIPEELFPPEQHYDPLPANRFLSTATREELLSPYIKTDDLSKPEENMAKLELKSTLEESLRYLTPVQQKMIKMRFGLEDGEAKTFAQIAEALETNAPLVQRRLEKALKNLKKLGEDLKEFHV
jgi:RNA polymerase sigma factor (sigma-70 family)